jgi:hypothetical protein
MTALKTNWVGGEEFFPENANDVATKVNTNTADIVTAHGVAVDAQDAAASALAAAGVADGKAVAALANAATAQSTANGKYAKPGTGIPSTDMTSAVATSLSKADTAYQAPAVVGAGATATAARAAISAAQSTPAVVYSQHADPDISGLTTGTEYVWLKTDGAGNLLDILSGVK